MLYREIINLFYVQIKLAIAALGRRLVFFEKIFGAFFYFREVKGNFIFIPPTFWDLLLRRNIQPWLRFRLRTSKLLFEKSFYPAKVYRKFLIGIFGDARNLMKIKIFRRFRKTLFFENL